MIVSEAQGDIRRAYVGGGPGLAFSALVWLAAGLAEARRGTGFAFEILFFGGMFIFPAGMFLSRVIFRRAAETKGNPLSGTALESTICMMAGLFAAWLLLPFKPAFVFPMAAIAVGTHFAVFKTVYGDRLFWVLGAALTGIGLYAIFSGPVFPGVAFAVAATEFAFGIILTVRAVIAKPS